MKPYIIDDRTIVIANVVRIIMGVVPFAVLYNWMWEYEDPILVRIATVIVVVFVVQNTITSIKHLKRYHQAREVHLRIDKEGIFMNTGELCDTVQWGQVKEIDICRHKDDSKNKELCIYVYLINNITYIFSLKRYLDGINIHTLRRSFQYFSNRPDIVKKRWLPII